MFFFSFLHVKCIIFKNYALVYAQQPAPHFDYWRRYEVGPRKKFTLTGLHPDTCYIACIMSLHNVGQASISRSLRFKTRTCWWSVDGSFCTKIQLRNYKIAGQLTIHFGILVCYCIKWMVMKMLKEKLIHNPIHK